MDSLSLLSKLGALARLPRTGWLLAGVPAPESIAEHSHGVALLAAVLGPRVEPGLDVGRAVALAVLHDAPEALVSDLPRTATELLPPGAKARAEERAAALLFERAPESLALWHEHAAGSSREARFVRLCDKLHLGLTALGYRRAGVRGLEEFVDGLRALDAGAFAPLEALRIEVLAALDSIDSSGPSGEAGPGASRGGRP